MKAVNTQKMKRYYRLVFTIAIVILVSGCTRNRGAEKNWTIVSAGQPYKGVSNFIQTRWISPENQTAPGENFNPISENRPVKVFILAGQSNAVGYNHIRELHGDQEDFKKQLNAQSRVLFWPGSNARPGFADRLTNLQMGVSDISGTEIMPSGNCQFK